MAESETDFIHKRPNQSQTVSHLKLQNIMLYKIITALTYIGLKIKTPALTPPQYSLAKNVFYLVFH